jgi:serine/threonine protein kinase
MLPDPFLKPATQLVTVFEFCPMGDVVTYTKKFFEGSHSVPELFLWHILKHVSCALDFLHHHGVVHGDVKPSNILLTAPRDGRIYPLAKISDFGSSSTNPPRNIPQAHEQGTMEYSPPEAVHRYGPEADI